MYGELTDKETVARVEYSLENQQQDQFEILLYKKNSEQINFYIVITKFSLFFFGKLSFEIMSDGVDKDNSLAWDRFIGGGCVGKFIHKAKFN